MPAMEKHNKCIMQGLKVLALEVDEMTRATHNLQKSLAHEI